MYYFGDNVRSFGYKIKMARVPGLDLIRPTGKVNRVSVYTAAVSFLGLEFEFSCSWAPSLNIMASTYLPECTP